MDKNKSISTQKINRWDVGEFTIIWYCAGKMCIRDYYVLAAGAGRNL